MLHALPSPTLFCCFLNARNVNVKKWRKKSRPLFCKEIRWTKKKTGEKKYFRCCFDIPSGKTKLFFFVLKFSFKVVSIWLFRIDFATHTTHSKVFDALDSIFVNNENICLFRRAFFLLPLFHSRFHLIRLFNSNSFKFAGSLSWMAYTYTRPISFFYSIHFLTLLPISVIILPLSFSTFIAFLSLSLWRNFCWWLHLKISKTCCSEMD